MFVNNYPWGLGDAFYISHRQKENLETRVRSVHSPSQGPLLMLNIVQLKVFWNFSFFVLTNVFQLSFLEHSTFHRITKRRFLSSVILLFIKENSFSFQFSVVKLSQFDICLNLISFLLRILQETTGIFYYSNWFSFETHPLSSTYIVYPFLRFSYIVWGEFSI